MTNLEKDAKGWITRLYKGFDSSSGKTPEFLAFSKSVKRWFELFCKENGCTHLDFHIGHFECSGYFTNPSGQIWYFNTTDVRGLIQDSMMIRKVESYKDYQGKGNRWVGYDMDMFVYLLKREIGL